MKIGKTLKTIRKERQTTLLELAQITGLSSSYLSYIESDKRSPNFEQINLICKALGVPVEVVLMNSVDLAEIENEKIRRFYEKTIPLINKISESIYAKRKGN